MRIRPSVFFLLVVSLILLLATGCSRDATPLTDRDDIVAYVNDVPVLLDDFERGQQQLLSQYQELYGLLGLDIGAQLEGAQGRVFELRIEYEALEMAITRSLVSEELARRDARIPEDAVEAEYREKLDALLSALEMSEQELEEAFATGEFAGYKTGGLSFDQFVVNTKQTIREEFEIQAVQRLIAGTVDHPEEALIAYFEEHRTEYERTERVRASHIIVADEELARLILEELTSGILFEALARDFSIDTTTSATGGELGWFERGRMVASFEEAAFSTPVGEISDIVRTELGYHIIRVTDYQPEVKPAYEDVADLVASDFEAEIIDQRFSQWHEAARSNASVSIEDLILDAFHTQKEDIDQGLQAFLRLRDEDLVDDPYLDYIIGTIYETKMSEAQSAKLDIEAHMTITPSQQEEVNALETEIATNRGQAIASYRASLVQLGESAEIEARIRFLNPGF